MTVQTYDNLIGGDWRSGASRSANINPSDLDDVVGNFAQAGSADVEDAIRAARAAFPAWSRSNPQLRFDILDRVGTELLNRKEEFGRLLSREQGKTLADGIGEVGRAGMIFKFFAGEALRTTGEKLDSIRPGVEVDITREAVGVIGVITPWNFPIAIPAWKIAPAICFGNCVVFKPAELAPHSAWSLVDLIRKAGLPDGVLNLVMGKGSEVGSTLVGSADVDAISFTGSQDVGHRIGVQASARGARVQLEMGGKNPLVVVDDADLAIALDCAVQGAFMQTGQRCTASSRLIVTAGIYDAFIEGMVTRLNTLVIDNALKPGVQIGPVIDARQLEKNLEYVAIGKTEGGRLIAGGEALKRETPGFYMSPALLVDTTPDMRVNREEIFGPVASVIKVRDYDEALKVANDTPFGLCAGICTTSLRYATDFRRSSQSGLVMVNLPTAGLDYHVPFGGRKSSSVGPREQGRYAVEFYTTVKTAYIRAA